MESNNINRNLGQATPEWTPSFKEEEEIVRKNSIHSSQSGASSTG
jgi:hypothetical protein